MAENLQPPATTPGGGLSGNNIHSLLSSAENNIHYQPRDIVNQLYSSEQLYRNMAMQNNHLLENPEAYYDPNLEDDFSYLNLSSTAPVHQSSASNNGGGGSVLGNTGTSLMDLQLLQRMRVQSAARGLAAGMYMQQQPQSFLPSAGQSLDCYASLNNSNAFVTPGLEQFDNLYRNGGSGRRNTINSPDATAPRINGFQLSQSVPYPISGYGSVPNFLNSNNNRRLENIINLARGRSTRNGYSDSLITSYWNTSRGNSNIYTSRLRPKFLESLQDLRGNVLCLATDQIGCRLLQKKFEERKDEDIDLIFSEIKDHIRELMLHQFGNYLVQKFFEVCNEAKISQILASVISHAQSLVKICSDIHGTRAMQKLLEHLTTSEQRTSVVSVLKREAITVALTKSPHGHHVVQHCLKSFPSEDIEPILRVVADNSVPIAIDRSGCCVLQQCVARATGEARERLVTEITVNALQLSQDPYGNYVVQFVMDMEVPCYTAAILDTLAGNFVSLSMDKYGSNVVEKIIKECSEDQAAKIISEIINSRSFLMVAQDAYGNYVTQTALQYSQGALREYFVSRILQNFAFLHSHPHGKRLLAKARGSRHASSIKCM